VFEHVFIYLCIFVFVHIAFSFSSSYELWLNAANKIVVEYISPTPFWSI